MEIVLNNEYLSVSIKNKGAELTSIKHRGYDLEYVWQADPAYWPKSSPILFPIVGALKGDTYRYNNSEYKLSRHGFARDMDFIVDVVQDHRAEFVLKSNDKTREVYPFEFELRISYTLQNASLCVGYSVTNAGKGDMFFSIGGHPAFNVPLQKGFAYDDYFLEFEAEEKAQRWPIAAGGLLETKPETFLEGAKVLPLRKELFYRDAVVLKSMRSRSMKLASGKGERALKFDFPDFPFFGIWAFKDADFVCLEPWCGVADSVDHTQDFPSKEGIVRLNASDRWKRSWTVTCL